MSSSMRLYKDYQIHVSTSAIPKYLTDSNHSDFCKLRLFLQNLLCQMTEITKSRNFNREVIFILFLLMYCRARSSNSEGLCMHTTPFLVPHHRNTWLKCGEGISHLYHYPTSN